jgi:hypothetical protein
MEDRDTLREICPTIAEHVHERKEEKEEKWLIPASEIYRKSRDECDSDSREDILTIFTILLDPERWDTEEIPYREGDESTRHEIGIFRSSSAHMMSEFITKKYFISFFLLSSECYAKKLSDTLY